jgi:hypothetical protein
MLLRFFPPADPDGQIRIHQPGICRFVRQSADRRESKVDGRCSVARLFQIDAVGSPTVLLNASRDSGAIAHMRTCP